MKQQQKTWQGSSTKRRNSAFFLFVFLGMLSAFAPFVTDMYLPSLPAMTHYFGVGVSLVQLGLTFSILGLAAGQIVFGSLSDKYGRKLPLVVSLILFLLATVGCIMAPNIQTFIMLRFAQGIAAAGGIVISRSIATDKFKGRNLAVALAIVGAINGVAPVVAPVIGGAILKVTSWRGVFAVLFVWGLLLTAASAHFRESLSAKRRAKAPLAKAFSLFKPLFSNRIYILCTLQTAFAEALLFSYISASPFIIQQHYGFSPFAFSLFFAANAVALAGGSAIAVKFKRLETGMLASCAGMLFFSALTFAALVANASVVVFEILLALMLASLGITFTVSTTLAMDAARDRAGTASALFGASCFLFGAAGTPLVGLGNILTSTGIAFVVCAALSLMCAVMALKR